MYVCKIMFPNFIPKSIVLIFVSHLKTHDLAIMRQTCIIWPPVHNTGLLPELCMHNIIMQLCIIMVQMVLVYHYPWNLISTTNKIHMNALLEIVYRVWENIGGGKNWRIWQIVNHSSIFSPIISVTPLHWNHVSPFINFLFAN